jgi:outer membrane protein assembly factor BamB
MAVNTIIKTGIIALLLAALLVGCADTDDFVGPDSSLPDLAVSETAPWPDMSPLPDGYISGAGNMMYAHSQSQLFSLDPKTFKVVLVGTFGPTAPDINDLAMTPKGQLYAISINDLYEVDHKTAQIKHVTNFIGTANVALTFEASGTLLASDKSGALRRIDPSTGVVTEIGSYGTNLSESGDLVAIKDGTLFGVNDADTADKDNQLMTIDPKTGKATVIGSIGYPRVWGLAYWGGTVYGLCETGELLAIDPKTGVGTLISKFNYEFWGAAVTPIAPLQ